jgi:hypothetical protein
MPSATIRAHCKPTSKTQNKTRSSARALRDSSAPSVRLRRRSVPLPTNLKNSKQKQKRGASARAMFARDMAQESATPIAARGARPPGPSNFYSYSYSKLLVLIGVVVLGPRAVDLFIVPSCFLFGPKLC